MKLVCVAVLNMNTSYESVKEFLENWLAPEDAEAVGLADMDRARENGCRMREVHEEMGTLPRCAKHGTVSVQCYSFLS